jgi:hypothetical protein
LVDLWIIWFQNQRFPDIPLFEYNYRSPDLFYLSLGDW